ncbi:MAG TPA: polysaccharide biosynthesis C-terminal domain-containing protein [Acidobacteriota bacterium]|nr:polysaccharide biosynthesis C-terminal domain-containing protein [Acidobacteriota bacterium]
MSIQALLSARIQKTAHGLGIRSHFVQGFLGLMLLKGGATFLLFLQQILVARLSGTESYGNYAFVLGWLTLLVLLGPLGFDTAAVRFVSVYTIKKNLAGLKGFFIRGLQIVASASAACALLVILVSRSTLSDSSFELRTTFAWGALYLFVLGAVQFGTAILQGLQRVHLSFIMRSLILPFLSIVGVLLFIAFSSRTSLLSYHVVAIEFIAGGIVSIVLYKVIFKQLPRSLLEHEKEVATGEWLRTAMPIWAHTGFKLGMDKSGIILSGILLGTVSSGLFSVSVQASNLLGFGLFTVSSLAAPRIARLFAEGKSEELQSLIKLSTKVALAFAVVSGLTLLVFGELLLGLFGSEFRAAYIPLCILIFGQVLNSFAGPVGSLLIMTGNERRSAKVGMLAFLVNLLFMPVLIHLFGLLGAALATTFTAALWNGLLIRDVRRVLKLNPTLLKSWSVS